MKCCAFSRRETELAKMSKAPLKSKRVLLCSEMSDLGRELAKCLLENDVKDLTVVGSDEERFKDVENLFKDKRLLHLGADVNKITDLEEVYKKVGAVDVIVSSKEVSTEASTWEGDMTAHINSMICNTLMAMKHLGRMNSGRGATVVNCVHLSEAPDLEANPASRGICRLLNDLDRSFGDPHYYASTGLQILTMCTSECPAGATSSPPTRYERVGERLLRVLRERKSSLLQEDEAAEMEGEVGRAGRSGEEEMEISVLK